jgi:hypothetical protein
MISRLGNYINKVVQVSIPALFGEAPPRLCQLIGVEPGGVWLESPELTRAVFPKSAEATAQIFVPFAQIAYIAVGTPPPAAESSPTASAARAPSARRRRRQTSPS